MTFDLDDEIVGFVVSSWAMCESGFELGRLVERVFEATVVADQPYVVFMINNHLSFCQQMLIERYDRSTSCILHG